MVSFPKQNFVLFMLSNLSVLFFMASGFYVLFILPTILLLKGSLFFLFFSFKREGGSLTYSKVRTGPQVSLDCWSKNFPTKSHSFSVVTSSLFCFVLFWSNFKGNSTGMTFLTSIASSLPPPSSLRACVFLFFA